MNDVALTVDLVDGRTVTVPLAWFPRLAHGTADERAHWRLIGGDEGMHWPDLDEDINVESLLAGRRSGETQESLRRWLNGRVLPGSKRKRRPLMKSKNSWGSGTRRWHKRQRANRDIAC